MQFALGYIAGIGTAALIFAILAFFRAGIEKRVKIIETVLGSAGPQPRGAIFLPDDDVEEARKKKIAENDAAGRDTPLSELI
jgi:hypothetical protein